MAKPFITIAGRDIGEAFPPLVIVEIGINHEGSLKTAFEMVDAAKAAGAEMIKHQTHVVEDEMSDAAKSVVPGNTDVSIYEVMSRCALNEAEEMELKSYVEDNGMIFISTAFSRAAADRLSKMDVAAIKIGSGECNNFPLIKYVANLGKPMIVSTGMNDIESVSKTVSILREYQVPYALLHCTNVYPTPAQLVRLGAMEQLQSAFDDAVIGLSDHTVANYTCFGAVALGGSILERHFTDRMDRPGPDIVCSMDPSSLEQLIEGVNVIFEARGGDKRAVEEEQPTIDFAFATIVTIQKINKGQKFTEENIWVKRPGTGDFLAEDYDEVLGAVATVDLAVGVHLKRSDVSTSG